MSPRRRPPDCPGRPDRPHCWLATVRTRPPARRSAGCLRPLARLVVDPGAHFDAEAGPHGALIVGGPDEVIEKIRHYVDVLGGITRLTFQMDLAALPHATLMRSIELLGTRVAPALQTPALVSV